MKLFFHIACRNNTERCRRGGRRMTSAGLASALVAALLALGSGTAGQAAERAWTGTTGYWTNDANWSGGVVPAVGDDVHITNDSAVVILDGPSAELNSVTVSKTLKFANWTTALAADSVTVQNGGILTVSSAFTTSQMSNRVYVVCSNLTVQSGGSINVNYLGYEGANGPGAAGTGGNGGGGGYGGRGGYSYYGPACGSPSAPFYPGSGGKTRAGGGAVRVIASGAIAVDGTIQASGASRYSDGTRGGGSGGGIWLDCRTFSGSGSITANGGNGDDYSGCGGGGRIAVAFDATAQSEVTPKPSVTFSVSGGTTAYPGELGSLYFTDAQIFRPVVSVSASIYFAAGVTNWTADSLTISNGYLYLPASFALAISNDLEVKSGGRLILTNSTGLTVGGNVLVNNGQLHYGFATGFPESLSIGANVLLTNSAGFYLYAGPTNAATAYGGLLNLAGKELTVPTNCAIYPSSHFTNGGSIKILVSNLTIRAGGSLNANDRGFAGGLTTSVRTGLGPGGGRDQISGGGYGGSGGGGSGGYVYGSSNAPLTPGSGAGYGAEGEGGWPGAGGGLVWAEASGAITLNGTVLASCSKSSGSKRNGGSGGGIFLAAGSFSGSGALAANGGGSDTYGGNGGGGRISVAIGFDQSQLADLKAGTTVSGLFASDTYQDFTGTLSATAGAGGAGGAAGTKRFLTILAPTQRTLKIHGSPAQYGSPATNGYGESWIFVDGTLFTNTVTSPVNESGGSRWACTGWRVTDTELGTLLADGSSPQAVFTISTNATLTWLWTNECQLVVSAGQHGTVNSGAVNGWYVNGTVVTGITATTDDPAAYCFAAWSGNVPSGQQLDNPLSVTMDQARTDLTAVFSSLAGETRTWSGTGDWTSVSGWSPVGTPGTNDTVVLQSGTIILSASRNIGTLVVSNGATLLVTNWDTCLTVANDIVVKSNGVITVPPAFADGQMSNRVYLVCSNLTVESGGKIDVAGKGYLYAQGPGADGAQASGGSHGGTGGNCSRGPYGAVGAPTCPGSGGGNNGNGGNGGGAIRIVACGRVDVEGLIDAAGDPGHDGYRGGGSGGSIYIDCRDIAGTAGILRADGGNGTASGGGGSGGRIAVIYDASAQSAVVPKPTVEISASGGATANTPGAMGTLYFPDMQLLQPALTLSGSLNFQTGTNWTTDTLAINGRQLGFQPGFLLTVTDALMINNGRFYYTFAAGNPATLAIGGSLTLTNSSALYLQAAATNGASAYGGLLNVAGGNLTIATNCAVYPCSDPDNGGSMKIVVGDLTVAAGGLIDANYSGYANDRGPGKGATAGYGASYGGVGGKGGGTTYGASDMPVDPGSGGDAVTGGRGCGGGLVWINASGSVVVNGAIRADGQYAQGAGSGGGIYLDAQQFSGSGAIHAHGGSSDIYGGGGGGGRIAIWAGVSDFDKARYLSGLPAIVFTNGCPTFQGNVSVDNGTGANPPAVPTGLGTYYFVVPLNPDTGAELRIL